MHLHYAFGPYLCIEMSQLCACSFAQQDLANIENMENIEGVFQGYESVRMYKEKAYFKRQNLVQLNRTLQYHCVLKKIVFCRLIA